MQTKHTEALIVLDLEIKPALETLSDPNLAVNLTFLTGVILIVLGLFNLGFLVNFISHAIIVGFCSAASIVIAGKAP